MDNNNDTKSNLIEIIISDTSYFYDTKWRALYSDPTGKTPMRTKFFNNEQTKNIFQSLLKYTI